MATPIPENRAPFSLEEVCKVTAGTLRGGEEGVVIDGVTTDTRGDLRGKLFVALAGDKFDGHRFVSEAVKKGAVAVVVRRGAPIEPKIPVIEVKDTTAALGSIAQLHRKRWAGIVVAVAGSAGKTTTRSAIAAALEAVSPGAVLASPGNLNNRIGVPMVLLGLTKVHAVAVVEIGTNVRGEVAQLTKIAAPNVGVLTLIDVEHAEGLGTLDDIEQEEGDLLRGLLRTGTAVANGDDERVVRQLVLSNAKRKITYGTRGALDYRIVRREAQGLEGSRVAIERPRGRGRETITLEVPLLGLPGALAIAAATAVADRVAKGSVVAEGRLSQAFSSGTLGEPGRLRPVELKDRTVILDDTYNANPASIRAAVATAREIADDRSARLILVVGEMRELGPTSAAEHVSVGQELGESGAAALIAIGGDAELFVAPAMAAGIDASFAADSEKAVELVLGRVRSGDVVLVKASRGVHAERVVEGLIRAKGRAA
jgi:UDP-N-acetylmuramoyl-tripeptide--D-alanyl-D-alanine ligase